MVTSPGAIRFSPYAAKVLAGRLEIRGLARRISPAWQPESDGHGPVSDAIRLSRTRFVQGDSRRLKRRLSKVRKAGLPHLQTSKEDGHAGAPEPKQIETRQADRTERLPTCRMRVQTPAEEGRNEHEQANQL